MTHSASPVVDISGEILRDLKLSDAVARYVAEQVKLGQWVPRTATTQRRTLQRFAADLPRARRMVGQVRRADVERWLGDQDVSPNALRVYLSNLRGFFRWAAEHDLLVRDPTVGIRSPRKVETPPRNLTGDQVAALLAVCDERTRVIVLLGVQEGLRISEIVSLDVADIDPDGVVVVRHGKGGKSRLVPLSAETAEAINVYLQTAPASLSDPLIRPLDGARRRLAIDTARGLVTDSMWVAGVKTGPRTISTHSLRHTMANDVLDQGADLRDVQELLGHASLQTTAIYARRRAALGRLRDAASGRRYTA